MYTAFRVTEQPRYFTQPAISSPAKLEVLFTPPESLQVQTQPLQHTATLHASEYKVM